MLTRRMSRVAITITAFLALSACAISPSQPPAGNKQVGNAPAAQPSVSSAGADQSTPAVLTQAQARQIHDRFERLIRRVSAAGGDGADQIEAGLALRMDRAEFRITKLLRKRPQPRPRVTGVRFFIPRPQTGPRWFLARTLYAGSSSRIDLLFQEGKKGWRSRGR